jgi:hypothetical protein
MTFEKKWAQAIPSRVMIPAVEPSQGTTVS